MPRRVRNRRRFPPVMRLLSILALLVGTLVSMAATEQPRPASGTLRLSLDTAIQHALAKNFEIQVDAYGPSLARLQTAAEFARFDPTIEGSFSRLETKDQTIGRADDP